MREVSQVDGQATVGAVNTTDRTTGSAPGTATRLARPAVAIWRDVAVVVFSGVTWLLASLAGTGQPHAQEPAATAAVRSARSAITPAAPTASRTGSLLGQVVNATDKADRMTGTRIASGADSVLNLVADLGAAHAELARPAAQAFSVVALSAADPLDGPTRPTPRVPPVLAPRAPAQKPFPSTAHAVPASLPPSVWPVAGDAHHRWGRPPTNPSRHPTDRTPSSVRRLD